MDTAEKLRQIKQSFRLRMNGSTSRSMREKGVDYHINWGVSLPDLKQMAKEYGKDYDLAIALWKEDIRECKILATMIMPAEQMLPEVADIWMEQTPSQEIAEQAAFNLYQYAPFASEKAFQWVSSGMPLYQVCGYHILARLMYQGKEPNERSANELLDQVQASVQDESIAVRHAAMTCIQRYAELGDEHREKAAKAMKAVGVELY